MLLYLLIVLCDWLTSVTTFSFVIEIEVNQFGSLSFSAVASIKFAYHACCPLSL